MTHHEEWRADAEPFSVEHWACVNILWSHNQKLRAPNLKERRITKISNAKGSKRIEKKNFLVFSLSCNSNVVVVFFLRNFSPYKIAWQNVSATNTNIQLPTIKYTAIQMYLICILHNLHGICWPNPCNVVIFFRLFLPFWNFFATIVFEFCISKSRIPLNSNKLIENLHVYVVNKRICGQLFVEIAKNQLINAVIITFNQLT